MASRIDDFWYSSHAMSKQETQVQYELRSIHDQVIDTYKRYGRYVETQYRDYAGNYYKISPRGIERVHYNDSRTHPLNSIYGLKTYNEYYTYNSENTGYDTCQIGESPYQIQVRERELRIEQELEKIAALKEKKRLNYRKLHWARHLQNARKLNDRNA